MSTLNILEHRHEVPADVFRDAKLLGFINKVAANLYRDPALESAWRARESEGFDRRSRLCARC